MLNFKCNKYRCLKYIYIFGSFICMFKINTQAECGGTYLESQHLGGYRGRITSSAQAWAAWKIPGQPELHSKTMFIKL